MARKKKNTVDYFPHDCYHSKELSILLRKHGNEGYVLYYRLFEVLGKTPNHRYEYNDALSKEHLSTEVGIETEPLEEIINTMVYIGVIDSELWEEHRTIWCDDFVESVSQVYGKRTASLPTKDSFRDENYTKEEVSEPEMRKVKESKPKEIKVEERCNPPLFKKPFLDDIKQQFPKTDVDYSLKKYLCHCDENDKTMSESGFSIWVERDERKGWNKKDIVSDEKTILYGCPNGHGEREVLEKTPLYHLCDECEEQYLKPYEIRLFNRNKIL